MLNLSQVRTRLAPLILGILLTTQGCHPAAHPPPASANADQKTFPIRGRIVATSPATGLVTLDMEAVPGYMDAMIMPYKLTAPNTLSELHPGDRITATLIVDQTRPNDPDSYRNPRLDQVVVISQARPDYKPTVQYHVPQRGDTVPDFHLLNQSGKIIHLAQFKGKVLLLTFIYTRCPLTDFCPRMSRNFADIDQALAVDPKLYAATHLLSISFDPTYDTPAVLKSYGGAYTGRNAKEDFHHWDFAATPVKDLPAITQFFNVGLTPGDNPQSLTHSLSTILIGKDGHILAWYPTNDWTIADMMSQIKAAA